MAGPLAERTGAISPGGIVCERGASMGATVGEDSPQGPLMLGGQTRDFGATAAACGGGLSQLVAASQLAVRS